jgi:Domain of unknown function (DUF4349)
MRIVRLPDHSRSAEAAAHADDAWMIELEAALKDETEGPLADGWRELRADVRSLAPPMTQEFASELAERVGERQASGRRRRWRLSGGARPTLVATAGALAALAVAVVIAMGSGQGGKSTRAVPVTSRAATSAPAAPDAKADEEPAEGLGPVATGAEAPAPGRKQQQAASVSLATPPGNVQSLANSVARLAVGDGGYVQSSDVQVQQRGTSQASIVLSIPSEHLSAALRSLGDLAALRGETQSSQDITGTYESARRRLADASAERQALLHALTAADTQGEIDSLRARLSQASTAVARAHATLAAVSRRASTSEVEVSIVGEAHAASEGSTLHRGLHDAGEVLSFVAVVLLIAATVLVPLALVLLLLGAGRGAWRRHQRERVLEG